VQILRRQIATVRSWRGWRSSSSRNNCWRCRLWTSWQR